MIADFTFHVHVSHCHSEDNALRETDEFLVLAIYLCIGTFEKRLNSSLVGNKRVVS